MATDAELLLAGPRGRRVCLEFARSCALESDTDAGRDAATTLAWAAHAMTDPAHRGVLLTVGDGGAPDPPEAGPADAAAALRSLALVPATAPRVREALAASVDRAIYWQPPDGEDALAAHPDVVEALADAAALVAASSAAAWWSSPIDLGDQWAVPWEGAGRASGDPTTALDEWHDGTRADDERAARERPSDPRAAWSGSWWSIPPHGLVRTTRSLGDGAPARLWFEEDSIREDTAVATPVEAHPARVIEITGPDDWADLCRRHPLDVTAARRHDWYRVTGRAGAWTIPDWRGVAAEADGVHLTVMGYLTAATRLIDLDGERATVLGGWNPDETFWFRGTLPRPGDAVRWERVDDEWRRAG